MKKFLFSLLMLCSMTAAWAGTGKGYSSDPYTGEWAASDLGAKLKVGDCLSYNCVIKNGRVTVFDTKVNKTEAMFSNWLSWAVGDAIDDTPWDDYRDYCSYNTLAERQKQVFIVTEFNRTNSTTLTIKGYYKGRYDRGDGSMGNPYWGEWTVSELGPKLKPGDHLSYDCVLNDGRIFVYDDIFNQAILPMTWKNWAVGDAIDDTPYAVYSNYCSSWNTAEDRKAQDLVITSVDCSSSGELSIRGHYNGTYLIADADGWIPVGSAVGLKLAINNDSHAKIKLVNDINFESYGGDISISQFSGTINGMYTSVNPITGALLKSSHAIYGSSTENNLQCNGAFFNELKGAIIEYVAFFNFSLSKDDEDNWGLICRTATNSLFRNILIQNVNVFCNEDNAGTIAGTATGCTFDGVMVRYSTVKVDGQYAGGLVGKSSGNCTYNNCMTDFATGIYCDGTYPDAYAGGIVGWTENDTFTSCINAAAIGALDDAVGGIAGRSEGTNFIQCNNSGQVVHCDKDEFDTMLTHQREKLRALTFEDIDRYNDVVSGLGELAGLVTGIFTGVGVGWGMVEILLNIPTPLATATVVALWEVGFYLAVAVAAMAVFALISWGFDELTRDDEVGGIVGRSKGGTIEECWNSGHLCCKQSYGGGIVGYADGTVINNCLNTDYSDFDENNCGSIVGYATGNAKVSNCFSAADYPIIGKAGTVDPNSVNNYRHRLITADDKRRATNKYEVETSTKQENSGLVALWLNNGAENRAAGKTPWRQDLYTVTTPEGKAWDSYPLLDPSHQEVKRENIALDYKIKTPEDLIAFAADVNSSTESNNDNQFLRGALMNDIDMTGYDWTPIGQDESYKQFRGFFDGRGHTIKGLKCNTGDKPAGLFGAVHVHAEIINVVLDENCEFTSTGDEGAGGIVGKVAINWEWGNVVIENCGNHGKVNGKNNAGGILGLVMNTTSDNVRVFVNNCFSTGDITAEGNSALLCGYMRNSGEVSNCWSTGKLLSDTSDKAFDNSQNRAEFFVGYYDKAYITNCYVLNPAETVKGATADTKQDDVTTLSATAVASGYLTYLLNAEKPSGIWQQNIGTDAHPMFGDKGFYHTRKVSNQYGTAYFPFAVKSDKNISYYTFDSENTDDESVNLKFSYAESIPARTPVLFRVSGTPTVEKPIEITFCDAYNGYQWRDVGVDIDGWTMVGTYQQRVFEGNDAKSVYYVSGGAIKNAKKTTIAPYRAYFAGPSIDDLTVAGAKTVKFVIEDEDGEATVIQYPIVTETLPSYNLTTSVYNLAGQKVDKNYRGIVIKNGKKVLVK